MIRVLAVDDAPELLQIVRRVLGEKGYEIMTAASGSEALAVARTESIDLAIVDYEIPPPDGIEVLRKLRRLRPGCVSILASGKLNLPRVIQAVNQGDISRVLAKPYDGQQLMAAVHEALQLRQEIGARYLASSSEEHARQRDALRECFEQGLLKLAAQPIVDASTRRVVAYEMLLRSAHPTFKGPLDVLQAAERCEQLDHLGEVVMQLAAARLPAFDEDVRLFVNLHPSSLEDPEALQAQLGHLQNVAARVVFEITERASIANIDAWESSLDVVASKGFGVALDDLGAGYNSLSVLAQIKPQFIKIDMSIIRGIEMDLRKRRLVELLCQFGKATDATVIAEGIETEAEASTIVECRAELMQGYLFGRPQI